jgi:hypothetical protein
MLVFPQQKSEGRIKCTLIPGDGVGPELMYSVQEVFRSADVPVDFETFFFSEVNPALSASLEDVKNSIDRNKICLKVTISRPVNLCTFFLISDIFVGHPGHTRLQPNWRIANVEYEVAANLGPVRQCGPCS